MRLTKNFKILFWLGISCAVSVPLLSSLIHKPLVAQSASDLIEVGFSLQNRSEVGRLRRQGLGWQTLRAAMLQQQATAGEASAVLATAKLRMAAAFKYGSATDTLWPVSAQVAHIQNRRVWLIEAAAPSIPFLLDCATGVSSWQLYQIRRRTPERCAHRVLVVEAQTPNAVLALKDLVR